MKMNWRRSAVPQAARPVIAMWQRKGGDGRTEIVMELEGGGWLHRVWMGETLYKVFTTSRERKPN